MQETLSSILSTMKKSCKIKYSLKEEEVTLSEFEDDLVLHVENTEEHSKTLLRAHLRHPEAQNSIKETTERKESIQSPQLETPTSEDSTPWLAYVSEPRV